MVAEKFRSMKGLQVIARKSCLHSVNMTQRSLGLKPREPNNSCHLPKAKAAARVSAPSEALDALLTLKPEALAPQESCIVATERGIT